MKLQIALAISVLFITQNAAHSVMPVNPAKKAKPAAFIFAGNSYFHRFTQADQHEYTPKGQENLNAWKDMVTILYYPKIKDGEGLAQTANAVLETYKKNKAMVLKTDSVPRTKTKPAEHLIVVAFPRPQFIEAVFARFRMYKGTGTAVIYSHRIYGKAAGDAMSAWLKNSAPAKERALMSWNAMPKVPGKK